MTEEAKPAGAFSYPPLDTSRALVPSVVRVNETLVKRGFWPKLRRVAGHIPFAEDVLALWFCAFDKETPTATKVTMVAALALFVMPKGFISKRMTALVFADEAAAVAAAVAAVGRAIKPRHREAARAALERLAGEG